MKKTTLFFILSLIMTTWSYGQCTTFSGGGPWTDFNTTFGGAPCDPGTGCPFNEISAFEMWADESYLMDNVVTGHTYTFSACNGPGAGSWAISYTIIAPSGAVDAFGLDGGSTCAITWTATEDGTYEIGVSEAGVACDTSTNTATNNGFPAITCSGASPCAGCAATAAPNVATTPGPADGAIDVPIDNSAAPTLTISPFTWVDATTGDPVESYNISLGITATGDDIGTLTGFPSGGGINYTWAYNTTYFWKVDAVNCFGTTTGTVWSFTTEMDPALSVEEFENSTFSVYPNPTNAIVNIKTEVTIDAIEVINMLGQTVKTFNSNTITNNAIDISALGNGLYFLNINAEGKKQTIRIIKE